MKKRSRSGKSQTKVESWAALVRNTISIGEHIFILGTAILFSTLLYMLLLSLINPHFVVPYSTTINWLTVNHYPKQQDTYLFVSFFVFVYVVSFLIWLLWVSLKIRKH